MKLAYEKKSSKQNIFFKAIIAEWSPTEMSEAVGPARVVFVFVFVFVFVGRVLS